MTAVRYDARTCALGEGPLWHPEREQLFWFDITGKRLLSQIDGAELSWDWEEMISAAGWIDEDTLLVAGATGLWQFEISSGVRMLVAPLEADNPATRSNDGRADPVGGFWIGTMGLNAEEGAGAIYRYFRGEVRKLYQDITIPNAICFSPDGMTAYFADTGLGVVWQQHIDRAGWPSGKPAVFADFSGVGLNPDGAVCDAVGNVWIAQWGVGRVACHGPDGQFLHAIPCPAPHSTCPAFGGKGLDQLFVTSATQGLTPEALEQHPGSGQVWTASTRTRGQREWRVVL